MRQSHVRGATLGAGSGYGVEYEFGDVGGGDVGEADDDTGGGDAKTGEVGEVDERDVGDGAGDGDGGVYAAQLTGRASVE